MQVDTLALEQSIFNAIRKYMPEEMVAQVPPRVFEELRLRFLEYQPNKSMTCMLPAPARYADAMGAMQGGMIGAALDAVYSCFSVLLARRPCMSISMDTSFIRPIRAGHGEFAIEVRLRAKTRGLLFLEGKAVGPDGRTLATSNATMTAYRDKS